MKIFLNNIASHFASHMTYTCYIKDSVKSIFLWICEILDNKGKIWINFCVYSKQFLSK